jgi:hypothetical protein
MILSMRDLTPETTVARIGEPLTTTVDGELVMLDPSQGRYFGLDPIGRRIWGMLEQPQSIGALCAALESEYDVSPERCRADVMALLNQLAAAELVRLA